MGTILIVDDDPAGRQFLTTLLGYSGHRLLEAADGAEALSLVRAEHPDLVIADILLPTMDGNEFVRQLRGDTAIARTPVIFYTATYHEPEAQALAKACGVSEVIIKPAEPEVILEMVANVLGVHAPPARAPSPEVFEEKHVRLLTDKLSHKTAVTQRLAALLEIGLQLASELDPLRLLENFCPAAREIIGARYAAVGLLEEGARTLQHLHLSGLDAEIASRIRSPAVDPGILARVLLERQPLRLKDIGTDPLATGFPASRLPNRCFLGVTIGSPSQIYGALYLLEKLGADEFTAEDERVIATLAAQAAVAYENARLYGEIQRRTAELKSEVSERKQAEEQIGKLNEELERRVNERTAELTAINAELEAFAYSIAHDLRAPLRHVIGFSRILVEEHGAGLEPETRQHLDRIHESARHMGNLVDDLLNLSRVGRKELHRQVTGLNSLVTEALSELKSEIEDRAIEWKIGRLPFVDCDPGLMKQVFTNLLSNALKYTRPRERAVIEVDQTTVDGQPVVFVRDNGVGFDMKYADKLFGMFQRLHRSEDFEGTGVGLAIVQRIIHKHGGRIWVEAELNRGARFYFTLPSPEGESEGTDPPQDEKRSLTPTSADR